MYVGLDEIIYIWAVATGSNYKFMCNLAVSTNVSVYFKRAFFYVFTGITTHGYNVYMDSIDWFYFSFHN